MVQYPILGSWRTSHWHGIFKGSGAEKAMEPLWDPSLAPKKAHPFQQFSSRHEESAFLRGNFDGNWEAVFTVFFLRMLFLQRRSGRHTETSMSTARFFFGGEIPTKNQSEVLQWFTGKTTTKIVHCHGCQKGTPPKKKPTDRKLEFFFPKDPVVRSTKNSNLDVSGRVEWGIPWNGGYLK